MEALRSPATELLYGGAAGGGKSHFLRVVAIRWCLAVPGIQVYLFRRTHPDLRANHLVGPAGLPAMLADIQAAGMVRLNSQSGEFRFINGSILKLAHLQRETDVGRYQGADIHVLLIDELTHFSADQYRFLRSRVRLGGLPVPTKYADRLPCICCATNPGSIGHAWVKAAWVSPKPPREIWRAPAAEGGMTRQYLPARLADNPTLAKTDPAYLDRLTGLGNPALVKALRDGDWDIVAGQAFEMWRRDRHVIAPFAIPPHWTRFRSLDWGSSKPFSVGWWAVADGDMGRIPAGALVRYREWYGWNGSPDEGLRLTSTEFAKGILERDAPGEVIRYTVADRAVFQRQDGPSVGEHMALAGIACRPSDSHRAAGYQEVRRRLTGTDGIPMLYVFDTCASGLIRTLPELVMDPSRPEDVDTRQEDHAYDETRYACMSRPVVTRLPSDRAPRDRWAAQFATTGGGGRSWRVT